ncbi:cobyrinate a,c-diamide synthase [Planctomycetota bacterium]
MIAALRGSGGKTLVSVGLTAVWREQGWAVAPFKKGPDYIDAGWLSAAAEHPCRNLDLFLHEEEVIRHSFIRGAAGRDLAVIEGNRGLFDGMDARGTCSSAELAKLLRIPVVLVLDCAKTTRTVGALVLGCQQFDPEVSIGGVVLNRVAGPRHESILREVIEQRSGLPILGVIPKLAGSHFPERHLGLVPHQEHSGVADAIHAAARAAEEYLDLAALIHLARTAPPLGLTVDPGGARHMGPTSSEGVLIGVCRDAAFQFYYPENLEALVQQGGRLVEVSPLSDDALPEVDALYIGGGFPETFAAELAENQGFRHSVAQAVETGLPVYAECGGAVYLGDKLVADNRTFPMAGALPLTFGFGKKPQGHGYAILEVAAANPYFPEGMSLRAHEFHYSRVLDLDASKLSFAFRLQRGHGFDGKHDGVCYRNVLASYCHLHALSAQSWAESLVKAAARFRRASPRR